MALMMAGGGPHVGAPVQAADGIVTRLIWTGADGVFSNAPSPDGKYMTYVDWESGNLAVRDLKAETSRLLTKEGAMGQQVQYGYASKWSPDGKQLVYNWHRQSTEELRIVSLDDPRPRILFREDGVNSAQPLDWSPNGQFILAGVSRTGQPDQLALIPVETGSPRVLKTFEPGSISSDVALFSPDGRYIVYDRTPGKVAALDLFVLDVRGGGETPLVRHSSDDCLFGWSPDGNWILFLSDRAGTLDFWAIRVADGKPQGTPVRVKRSVGRVAPLGFVQDGSFYYADVKVARDVFAARIDFQTGKVLTPAEKAIERYEGSNMNPQYSPDGRSLAYVSRRGGMVFPTNRANVLCIHSLESGGERLFMDEFVKLGVRAVAGPRWSLDSRSIVVAGLGVVGAGSGLYLVSLDTGNVSPVAEMPPGVRIRNHELSPENRRLFYIREDTKRKLWQILERDLRNGKERELYRTSGDEQPRGIAVSPDGKWLAMFTNRSVLSVFPSSGGTPRVVHRFEPGRYTNPEWTRDGKYVLVGGNARPDQAKGILYRVPVEGGESQEIVLQRSSWDRITMHPDGRQIAFTATVNNDSDADVWVMQNFLPGLGARKGGDTLNK
jgi:Tol biopolymer transport system component